MSLRDRSSLDRDAIYRLHLELLSSRKQSNALLLSHDVVRSVRRRRFGRGLLNLLLGQPEVTDLDRLAVPTQKYVPRFQVAVDDALTVGVGSIPEDARTPFLFGLSRSTDLCESRMRTSYGTQPTCFLARESISM